MFEFVDGVALVALNVSKVIQRRQITWYYASNNTITSKGTIANP